MSEKFVIKEGRLTEYNGIGEREVVLPDGITHINDNIFTGNTSIRKIVMPDSVVYMGWNQFKECKYLSEVKLSEKLDFITNYGFSETALEEIIIPQKTTEIMHGAFSGCKKLKKVVILSDRMNIERNSFEGSPDVVVYCNEELHEKIGLICNVPCLPLEDYCAESTEEKYVIYRHPELLKGFIDGSNSVEKAKKIKTNVDGVDLEVRLKASTAMEKILPGEYECRSFYSLYTADKYWLSREQVRERIDKEDRNHVSEAYDIAKPEISSDAPHISKEEMGERCKFICDVYKSLENPDVLAAIAKAAPKKKNKTYAGNKYTRIACAAIVNNECEVFGIVGKPKNDTVLEVFPKFVRFSPDELALIENDFLTNNVNMVINGDGVGSPAPSESVPSNKKPKVKKPVSKSEKKYIELSYEDVTVRVPVIENQDGSLSFAVKPNRRFDSFSFIRKIENGKYAVCPDFPKPFSVSGEAGEFTFSADDAVRFSWNRIALYMNHYYEYGNDKSHFAEIKRKLDPRFGGEFYKDDKLDYAFSSPIILETDFYSFICTIECLEKIDFSEFAKKCAASVYIDRFKKLRMQKGNLLDCSEPELDIYYMTPYIDADISDDGCIEVRIVLSFEV